MSSMRTGKNFFGDKLNKEEIKEHRGLTGQLSMRESSLVRALSMYYTGSVNWMEAFKNIC